jgi:hypothetical protein
MEKLRRKNAHLKPKNQYETLLKQNAEEQTVINEASSLNHKIDDEPLYE